MTVSSKKILKKEGIYPKTLRFRAIEWGFRLLEMLLVPQIMMLLNRIFKPNTRKLTAAEMRLARQIFGNSVRLDKVFLDEKSVIACRRYDLAYVGFYFINSWETLSPDILLHELVHVWQYEKFGAVYIPRALWAQRTEMGYNYGGGAAIRAANHLLDFNYEQQGEVVADYFRLLTGRLPNYCAPDISLLSHFRRILGNSFI